MHCINRLKYRIIVNMVRFSLRRLLFLFIFFIFFFKCNSQKESCAFNFSEDIAFSMLRKGGKAGKACCNDVPVVILYSRHSIRLGATKNIVSFLNKCIKKKRAH